MKLVTFRHDGKVRHGRLIEDGTVVLPLGDGDLSVFLARSDGTAAGPAFPLADVELLAPLLRPGKLLAVEKDLGTNGEPSGGSRTSPRLFLKPPTSVAGPGADVPLSPVGEEVAATPALAVVIGVTTRDVPVEEALDVVGGYATATELAARSLDLGHARGTGERTRFSDRIAGTWLDGFAPLGPYLVTPDEVPDPQAMDSALDVNGERRRDGSTKDVPFPVAELVSFASALMTLEPGDVIVTGTATEEPLAAGDEVSVTVGNLGTLTNRLVTHRNG